METGRCFCPLPAKQPLTSAPPRLLAPSPRTPTMPGEAMARERGSSMGLDRAAWERRCHGKTRRVWGREGPSSSQGGKEHLPGCSWGHSQCRVPNPAPHHPRRFYRVKDKRGVAPACKHAPCAHWVSVPPSPPPRRAPTRDHPTPLCTGGWFGVRDTAGRLGKAPRVPPALLASPPTVSSGRPRPCLLLAGGPRPLSLLARR